MNRRESELKTGMGDQTGTPSRDGECSARICISGLVQGVGYRSFARRVANLHTVSGTVRNLPDGRVQVVAWGTRDDLEALIQELRRGPFMARVEDIQVEWRRESPRGRVGFEVV